ncbi:unnamed protein product [Penicillium salamii]|nr:unnamed protein product [Penicillium salamii]CAG8378238.1 unnamed protein product [Penicillium salamii]
MSDQSDMESSADVLIIGGGPAGLAAAMALGRACRSVVVFDSQEYRNDAAPKMHNVLGSDGKRPELFRVTAVQDMMAKYDSIKFVDTKIKLAFRIFGEFRFHVVDNKGRFWRGQKLILASGSKDVLPSIPGYKELYGRGIIHSLFCEGFEKNGGHFGILGLHTEHELNALFMSFRLAESVMVFTNGEKKIAEDPAVSKLVKIAVSRGAKIDRRAIESISEGPICDGILVHFKNGSKERLRVLINSPPTVNRLEPSIISELGLETHGPEGHVVSKSPMGKTNVHGCFVAGDTSTLAKTVNVAMAAGKMTLLLTLGK